LKKSNPKFSRTESLTEQVCWLAGRQILFQELKLFFCWSPRWFFLRLKCLGTAVMTLALYAHEWKPAHAQDAPDGPNRTCSEKEAMTATTSGALLGGSWYHHPSCQLSWTELKKSPLEREQKYPCQGWWEWRASFSYFCSLPAYPRSRWSTCRFLPVAASQTFGTGKKAQASRVSKTLSQKKGD